MEQPWIWRTQEEKFMPSCSEFCLVIPWRLMFFLHISQNDGQQKACQHPCEVTNKVHVWRDGGHHDAASAPVGVVGVTKKEMRTKKRIKNTWNSIANINSDTILIPLFYTCNFGRESLKRTYLQQYSRSSVLPTRFLKATNPISNAISLSLAHESEP